MVHRKTTLLPNKRKYVSEKFGEDRDSHHLITIRKPPESVIQLAQRLQQPPHADILAIAQKGNSFEECIGTIGTLLDIVIDGDYDVDNLATLLVKALDARGTHGNQPHKLDSNLLPVELVERKDSFELILAEGTIAPPPTDVFTVFMREHGCRVCENKSACLENNRCLGASAIDAAKGTA